MNRRGKRLTFGVMAVGLAVLLSLAIAHWSTVRDHLEVWHFQLTRETVTIASATPFEFDNYLYAEGEPEPLIQLDGCLLALAADLSRSVVFDSALEPSNRVLLWNVEGGIPVTGTVSLTALKHLRAGGFRVLEQRFPRRAYIVILDESP
jgi:hypothetical protein